MKRNLKIVYLAVLCLVCVVQFAAGNYAPKAEVPEGNQTNVRRAAAAFKRLPKIMRQAFIAERLGLCFQPSGGNIYARSASEFTTAGISVQGYYAYTPAVFVGTDGKVYRLRAATDSAKKHVDDKPRDRENLQFAVRFLYEGYPEAVFSKFSDEITQMCIRTAKNRLDVLPAYVRDAFLAELTRQLYVAGNGKVYSGEKKRLRINGTDTTIERDAVDPGAMFADSTGAEHDFCRLVHDEVDTRDLYRSAWDLSAFCVELIGAQAILELYADEVEAIKKFRRDVEEYGAPVVDEKKQTKVVAAKNPETSRSITALHSLPRTLREAYFAERLGFCFLPNGGDAYREDWLITTREGMRIQHYPTDERARFVDSKGKEFNLSEKLNKKNYKQNADSLRKLATDAMRGIYSSAGDQVLKAFEKEIAEMALQTAKNRMSTFPPLLRSALLAETGKLLFLPDGDRVYTGKMHEWKIRSCQRVAKWPQYDANAHFIATDGKEYKMEDVMRQFRAKYEQRILLCKWCILLAGRGNVLACFANEVETMKKLRN